MTRILVVDDNEDVASMICEIVESKGYEFTKKANGRQAIEHLEKDLNYHIIITDIIMPDQDGLDLLQYLKEKNITIPTIALSGGGVTASSHDTLRAAEEYATILLRKPVGLNQLLETIAALSSASK